MNESKKLYNKWMVIPFENKLYEKLNEEENEFIFKKIPIFYIEKNI